MFLRCFEYNRAVSNCLYNGAIKNNDEYVPANKPKIIGNENSIKDDNCMTRLITVNTNNVPKVVAMVTTP